MPRLHFRNKNENVYHYYHGKVEGNCEKEKNKFIINRMELYFFEGILNG